MDDELLLNKTLDEHLDVLDKVLTPGEGATFKIINAKCQYFTNCVEYLDTCYPTKGRNETAKKTGHYRNHISPKC